MRTRTSNIAIILGAAFSMMLPAAATAQTCRVSCGMHGNGQAAYKLVYEFDYVEEKPEFPGGGAKMVSFINHKRRYPARAYDAGIEGRVMCSFVVDTDGAVSHVTVIKGVEDSLNKEAVRVISEMPAWTPGKIDGRNVPVRVICAVPFRR